MSDLKVRPPKRLARLKAAASKAGNSAKAGTPPEVGKLGCDSGRHASGIPGARDAGGQFGLIEFGGADGLPRSLHCVGRRTPFIDKGRAQEKPAHSRSGRQRTPSFFQGLKPNSRERLTWG